MSPFGCALLLIASAAPDAGAPVPGAALIEELSKERPPYLAPDLTVPGALETTEVPGNLDALGVPVKLKAVRSKLGTQELMAHFRRAFREADLFVVDDGQVENPGPLPHVTALDPFNDISWSVLFQPNLDGTTTVLLGTAYLHARTEPSQGAAFAPVFPGALDTLVSRSEAGNTLSYAAKATPEVLADFYRKTLGEQGFVESEEGIFSRGGRTLRVFLQPRSKELTGVVVLEAGGDPTP